MFGREKTRRGVIGNFTPVGGDISGGVGVSWGVGVGVSMGGTPSAMSCVLLHLPRAWW